MIMKFSSFAMRSSRFEARTVLVSLLFLSTSLLSFKLLISLIVLILSLVFNIRIIKTLTKFLPLILIYLLFSILFGGFSKFPTFVSILSLYLFLHNSDVEELSSSLIYFKLPPRFAYAIAISVRFLQNVLKDLEYLNGLRKFEKFSYLELLKRLTNLIIIRAIAMAESMESRGFNLDKRIKILRKPTSIDWLLLTISASILVLSLFRF